MHFHNMINIAISDMPNSPKLIYLMYLVILPDANLPFGKRPIKKMVSYKLDI